MTSSAIAWVIAGMLVGPAARAGVAPAGVAPAGLKACTTTVVAGLKACTTTVVVQTFRSARAAQVVQTFRSAQVVQGAPPTDAAERGKTLYLKYGCYQCHGRQGQGAPSTGPRIGPAPMALTAFARYVRQPRGEMPPYTVKVVTDQELADMHAFLRSVPRPPAIATLPFDR